MIAMTLALNHPGSVKALVISACPHSTPAADRALVAKRGEDGFAAGMASVVEATLTRWFTPHFRNSATVQDYRRRLLAGDTSGWKAGWRAISTYDVRARLPELSVPVLCVAGRDDASVPLPVMQEMAMEISGAQSQLSRMGRICCTLNSPTRSATQSPVSWPNRPLWCDPRGVAMGLILDVHNHTGSVKLTGCGRGIH